MNILVSACLLGFKTKFDGTDNSKHMNQNLLEELKKTATLIPFCPEIYGGLKTPRSPSEVNGKKIIDIEGKDNTLQFTKGAEEALKATQFYDCKAALLKEKSPSCSPTKIYDGTFSKKLIDEKGITAKLLEENEIKLFGETQLEELILFCKEN